MSKKLHPDFIAYWEKQGNIYLDGDYYNKGYATYYCKISKFDSTPIAFVHDDERKDEYFITSDSMEKGMLESLALRKIKLIGFI